MSNHIHDLLHRNLQEVFGEGDPTRRRAAIAELYTEDCELYVPPGKFVGREALDKFAGDLRATHPHFVYTPHGEPQALQDAAGRLAWGSGPPGAPPRLHRPGCNHRSRRQDRRTLRLPGFPPFNIKPKSFLCSRVYVRPALHKIQLTEIMAISGQNRYFPATSKMKHPLFSFPSYSTLVISANVPR